MLNFIEFSRQLEEGNLIKATTRHFRNEHRRGNPIINDIGAMFGKKRVAYDPRKDPHFIAREKKRREAGDPTLMSKAEGGTGVFKPHIDDIKKMHAHLNAQAARNKGR